MIRVLHVITWFKRGGVETQLLRILRKHDRDRFRMDVCCIGPEEGELADSARESGSEILRCPRSINVFGMAGRFDRLIRDRAYDIVHSHFDIWSGPLLRGANMAGVPVRVAHMRSCAPGGSDAGKGFVGKAGVALMTRLTRRWLQQNATTILGVSETTLDVRWPEWRSDAERYGVWTGGVDTERFAPPSVGGRERNGPVIVNVGSFRPVRNHEMLLDVFALVQERIPEARLVLIGEGGTRPEMRKKAERMGIGGSVRFAGLCDNIPELLGESDVFVTCSRVEGLPNALLEAQASGLPVVASDIPPHREVLCPGLREHLFPLKDPGPAADAVVQILEDPDLRSGLGKQARDHVTKHYEASGCMSRLQDLYTGWVDRAR